MARKPSKTTRDKVYQAWGRICIYCGKPSDHLDHLVPFSRGGPSKFDNLRPACTPCGTRKGDKDPYEWLKDYCPEELREAVREVWHSIRSSQWQVPWWVWVELPPAKKRPPDPKPATKQATRPARRRPRWVPGPGGPGGRTMRRYPGT